ncbi:MAG: (E)-4-hydroxy-3-methylbut-2-enyl-diphosphate synthase [Rhizobacter sp.]|nr:(E)-4-hydroxy-3-methylbut-2-enyl-diphosphate synthase [Chlorobiales bacterium]
MYDYTRRKTVPVMFGDLAMGAAHPIRVESMTTTNTLDIAATVEQSRRLYEAGCEIIRITAPSIKEAEALKFISERLRQDKITTPLVADIHFTPNAAMKAAEFVENVRINPGNYADRKKFAVRDYTDLEYEAELERLHDEFKPLVLKCKQYGRSMRIGTNHGSLSDRVLNRYGDTPLGMVESALEFARICEQYDYYEFIFSMKSSNTQVMIEAYRLLASRGDKELKHAYPLHLGVTEAGDGDEARIKSSVGIGGLLDDGLGDTVRVSLTEDPVKEIPIGQAIVKKYNERQLLLGERIFEKINRIIINTGAAAEDLSFDPYQYQRRESVKVSVGNIEVGGDSVPRVELEVREPLNDSAKVRDEIIFSAKPYLFEGIKSEITNLTIASASELARVQSSLAEKFVSPVLAVSTSDFSLAASLIGKVEKIRIDILEQESFEKHRLSELAGTTVIEFSFVKTRATDVAVAEVLTRIALKCKAAELEKVLFSVQAEEIIYPYRRLAEAFKKANVAYPIVLRFDATKFDARAPQGYEAALVESSIQLGSLLCDGIGDMVAYRSTFTRGDELNLVYNILQAARLRLSKTEFISCPSCGRTLFDLETVTATIKARTEHLKGLKIGIMGCIVNGPGEMADADFGYVGTGVGEISLYVGKECVEKHIPSAEAVDKLVDLIKQHGKWREPSEVPSEVQA